MSPTIADPVLPGVYPTYEVAERTTIPPNAGAVVAVPIIHNWGPDGELETYTSLDAWEEDFGTAITPGRIAVVNAFTGIGVDGEGGAGGVIVTRMAGAAAAKSVVVLKNPANANALRVEGVYKGTRGDDFDIMVSPVVNGVQDVIVLDGTVEVESFSYRIADVGALAGVVSQLLRSANVRGTLVLEGTTGLAPGTFSLTGGNDGTTLTGQDWLSGTSPYQDVDFAYMIPFDLPYTPGVDSASVALRATITSLIAWRDDQERVGHRFSLVFGMALDTLPADAIAAAAAISNPSVILIGGPGWEDDAFGSLSASQMAPRYGGIRAFRGESGSADLARIAGGVPRKLPTGARVSRSNVEDMVLAGCIVLDRDRYAVAPGRIAADVTSYQPNIGTNGDPDKLPAGKPKGIYGTPKFVLSMQQFANDAQAELERQMIGKTVVNDATRNAAAARILRMARERERIGAFSTGTKVEPVAGSDTDKFIRVKVSLTFGRALTQLFIQSTVR